jgi:glycosyltransferase involved in cell wall biosynthesis
MFRLLVLAFTRPADIYHFQWFKFPPIDFLIVFFLRRLARANVVFTAHNVVPHGAEQGRHRFLGLLYREVDHIVVHNASTAEDIARRFSVAPDHFSVVPHGIISLKANGVPEHKEIVRDFATSHDACFLFFGRGSRYKGLDILLQAWPKAATGCNANAGLIVMGAIDDDIKAIAQSAADRSEGSLLLVDEFVSEADLFNAVECCDVVVLPHRSISQSGVLLSVLGLGVPVLVSALPGLLEPFAIAPVGWEFDGSEGSLVTQLSFLIDHADQVAAVRDDRESWDAVRAAYDWKTIARRSVTLYQELVATAARDKV